MGRKKKSRKEGVGSTEDLSWQDELVDVLGAILEDTGIWDPIEPIAVENNDPWKNLSESLNELVGTYQRLTTLDPSLQNDNQDDGDDSILLLESCAQTVLMDCNNLNVELDNKSTIFDLLDDIESIICDKHQDCQRIRVLSKRLLTASRQQQHMATKIIQTVRGQLSLLHGGPSGNTANVDPNLILVCADKFKRHCVDSSQSPWIDVVKLVKELQPEGDGIVQRLTKLGVGPVELPTMGKAALSAREVDGVKTLETGHTNSIMEEVELFIDDNNPINFRSILLVGPEGYGKTFQCNQIKSKFDEQADVIMPMLPLDIMGRTVGEAEDNIVSLFSYCFLQHRKTILILDNLENLVESKENQSSVSTGDKAFLHRGAPQSHSIARTESTFLSLLDKIHQLHHVRQNRLLVICTVANDVSITMGRFDRVFHLSYPSSKERKLLVTSEIGIKNHDDDRSVKSLLSDVVEITLGMSFAEISHCCREALQNAYNSTIPAPEDNAMAPENVLNQLKRSLQSRIPESLRHGVNDDFVDISVITARELVHGTGRGSDGGSPALPLVGHQAVAAWKEMEKLILFPLCRSEALNSLIFGEGKSKAISRKVFLGGVLLTGPPGSGKSALSYHCATVAASILPTVKLIDVSCTSLIHKEVGGSERAVHKLFEIAKSAAPCILVMDGLENVATVRGNDMTTEGTMDRVLSTLLTELDGVDNDNLSYESGGGIVIIGITHDPKWIDPALRRPGRIEKEISLTYPDKKAATAIIHKELSREIGVFSNSTDYRVSDDLIDFLATNVEGMSGAAIISVCDQAKIICARRHLERPGHDIAISRQDFIEALGFEYK